MQTTSKAMAQLPWLCLYAALRLPCRYAGFAPSISFGQICCSPHFSQWGERAVQTYLPWSSSQWCACGMSSLSMCLVRVRSTLSGVLSPGGTRPSLWLTRKTWVSTAMAGLPKATAWITLAVLRPTPGRASRESMSDGTSPPCFSMMARAIPHCLCTL